MSDDRIPPPQPPDEATDSEAIAQLRAELATCRAELATCRAELAIFRGIVNGSDDAITIKDREGRFLFANPAAAHLVGREPDDIPGRRDEDFFPPQALSQIQSTDAQVIATGVSASYELAFDSPIWGPKAHLSNKLPYRDASGEVAGVVAVVREITERKRMELALRESESRYRGLAEATFEGVALHDNGIIIEANQAFATMVGYTLDELIGMNGFITAAPEYHDAILTRFRDNDERPYEIEAVRKDGTRFFVEMVGKPAQFQGRDVRVSAFRDVTVRRAMEDSLRRQNEQLKELDELKSAFVGSVSHELRTPLTSIRGYAEFLEDGIAGALNAEQLAFVNQITQGTVRLERLVDDLLDFARLESGSFKLACQEADMGRELREARRAFEPQARERGVVVEVDAPDEGPMATVDPGRLMQVVVNLVGNALKFTPSGGTIRLGAARKPDGVRVWVQDSGPGIAIAHQAHLFDRFYQVDPSNTRETGGTGLGLAISKALVEAHGGTIGVDSQPGQGATFWFTLPDQPA